MAPSAGRLSLCTLFVAGLAFEQHGQGLSREEHGIVSNMQRSPTESLDSNSMMTNKYIIIILYDVYIYVYIIIIVIIIFKFNYYY